MVRVLWYAVESVGWICVVVFGLLALEALATWLYERYERSKEKP